jgi:hypothetical protein
MKSATVLVGVLAVCLFAGAAAAHPPKDVSLEFDPDNHMLTVTATHDTRDVTKHYVGTIQVSLNGDKIIEQKFKSQLTPDIQVTHYFIYDAKMGDELSVTALCSIAGKKTVTLKIEKPKPAEGNGK